MRAGTVTGVLIAAALLVVTVTPAAGHPSGPAVVPVTAADTVETAIAFSRLAFPDGGAREVLLGRDDLFSDSLAAGSGTGRPILLTATDALDARVRDELARLHAGRVTILGGTEAISRDVERSLEQGGYTVTRRGGATRIHTAISVARHFHPAPTAPAVLARAAGAGTQAFADTLGGSALAHRLGGPLLLTPGDRLHDGVARYLRDAHVREVVVAGGGAAIDPSVVAAVRDLGITVRRAAGTGRTHTALAQNALRGLPTAADASAVLLVDGFATDAWAAGFAAAAWAAADDIAIVLASGGGLDEITADYLVNTPDPTLYCAPTVTSSACRRAEATLRSPAFATVGGITLRQPSTSVDMIGFHESNHDGARQLEPLETGARKTTLESRGRGTGSRSAADVVAQPGVRIRAPVTGRVIRAGSYVLYCRYSDDYAVIEPDDHPGWEVKLLHMEGLSVEAGDRVVAGETVLAAGPRHLRFRSQVDDHSSREDWPHVHLEVVDPSIPDESSGSC